MCAGYGTKISFCIYAFLVVYSFSSYVDAVRNIAQTDEQSSPSGSLSAQDLRSASWSKYGSREMRTKRPTFEPHVTIQRSRTIKNDRLSDPDNKPAVGASVGNAHRRTYSARTINQDWLMRNLTALWRFMRQIKRDVKQLKKQSNWKKGTNVGNKSIAPKQKEKVIVEEVGCDKSWFEPHPSMCKASENATLCAGNGNCECGQCICKSPHYGQFCQCNDMSCPSFEGELCGGVRHGQCRCGECVCRPNFSGSSCECSTEADKCDKDGVVCSNKGSCICNSCQCADGFTGELCQEDIYSASLCESMKPCVLCQAYGITHHKCENCNLRIEIVQEVTEKKNTCVYFYRGCFLKYSYAALQTEGEPMTVYTSEKLNCD